MPTNRHRKQRASAPPPTPPDLPADPTRLRDQMQTDLAPAPATDPFASTYALCRLMVQTAVPLHIMQIQARGGITDHDLHRVATYGEEFAGERGVYLLFRSPRAGETARLFNHLCEAIAVLAFVPGGITFCGDHYAAQTSTAEAPSDADA
jgi:hypothetical protein